MSETIEVTGIIETMERARVIIEDDILIIAELRARIKQQQALIAVALGYIRSGRTEMAAIALAAEEGGL